jgi:hypothetical protein
MPRVLNKKTGVPDDLIPLNWLQKQLSCSTYLLSLLTLRACLHSTVSHKRVHSGSLACILFVFAIILPPVLIAAFKWPSKDHDTMDIEHGSFTLFWVAGLPC